MNKKKTNKEKLKEVFKINLDDKDGEYYLSYCYQALDSVLSEVRDQWINTPLSDWLNDEYKGDDRSDDEVIKSISDMNHDLLEYIKLLKEDNKLLKEENKELMIRLFHSEQSM
jgi:hypothetical protein